MAFYDLPKPERDELVNQVYRELHADVETGNTNSFLLYYADEDTYIRKTAYLATGRIWSSDHLYTKNLLKILYELFPHALPKVRQTVVNAAGEIGKKEFETVRYFFDTALFDPRHIVRNAVIGSVKKMGEVNPVAVLAWAQRYLHHTDKEVRREICHGIELRGRKHPEDILPLLQQLENDPTSRVRNTLVHVLGQIAYKKGCLEKVLQHLEGWKNTTLVNAALEEIIDVHHRYRSFSFYTQEEATRMVREVFSR